MQMRLDLLGQDVVFQDLRRGVADGGQEGATQEQDLHKVVKMAGLQRGVLSVIGKPQEFLGLRVECHGVVEQIPQCGHGQHRRRRAAALAAQGRQLGQVTAHGAVVGDTTLQAKPERAREEPPGHASADRAVRRHRHGERTVPPVGGLQSGWRGREVDPVFRVEAVLDIARVKAARRYPA